MKIKTTVEQALEVIENINNAVEGTQTNGNIQVHFEVTKDEVLKIAKQESVDVHEPTTALPQYWTAIKFDKVAVYFQTEKLKTKLIFE